jgi:hydrogenase maturation protease
MTGLVKEGSAEQERAAVLVLGVGNLLLSDDAVGLRLLEELARAPGYGEAVEFMDGGTQGLALLPHLADRRALLVLDAVAQGLPAGTLHVLRGHDLDAFRARRASNAHESNALELLETARILGYSFERAAVVGVEPASVRTGIGLSRKVEAAMDGAAGQARAILGEMVEHVSCYSR